MKHIHVVLLLIAVIAVGIFAWQKSDRGSDEPVLAIASFTETTTITTDTTLSEPTTVVAGEATVLTNGGVLTAEAPMVIDGALGCRDGALTLVAKSTLTINGTVTCEGDGNSDVTIIAEGGLVMAKGAAIITTGNVQLVDSQSVVRSPDELTALYDAVERESEIGVSVGPFVDDTEDTPETAEVATDASLLWLKALFPTAHAQVANGTTTVNLTGEPIVVSGRIVVGTPREGAKRIVVFDFPNTPEVTIQDFELEGPDGRVGEADSGSCDVEGKPGEDAFRFNAFAPNLTVNNFTLVLGDGGEGGEATTGDGCDDARAKGGKGGKPGNFRMIGSQNFEITGAFIVHPGRGGAGGGATAIGKDGDPKEKGGDARATGGKGADNKKKLTVLGTVAGTSNVQFGDAVGGHGGAALAEGGQGGDAEKCGEPGGPGGAAAARSGDGGDAKLTVTGGAVRMEFANDIGGQGGITEATGGAGGVGGSCEEQKPGGNGGQGGSAVATEGKGGFGKSGRAADGGVLDETGGDGGDGGDGCTEGAGGKGGTGDPDGADGNDGKNTCITITKEEDYVSLLPGEIQIIMYMDYEIPLSNLRVAGAANDGCDSDHYHPAAGGAFNTMGYNTPDPDPNGCGFGKVSDTPVLIIRDPNYVEPEASSGGGQMIQIDPPTLVIPAGQSGF